MMMLMTAEVVVIVVAVELNIAASMHVDVCECARVYLLAYSAQRRKRKLK